MNRSLCLKIAIIHFYLFSFMKLKMGSYQFLWLLWFLDFYIELLTGQRIKNQTLFNPSGILHNTQYWQIDEVLE